MKLIVGLGNPGSKYQMTRHNIGFMVIDALVEIHRGGSFKQEHKAHTQKLLLSSQPILLAKPQTYMNNSGESVRALVDYYNIDISDLLIIHDDIDQAFGAMKYQKKRGHGGQNGIRSIHQHLGTNDYARLKMGVGRPSHPAQDVANYVLQDFSRSELKDLPDILSLACESVEVFAHEGLENAANRYNGAGGK